MLFSQIEFAVFLALVFGFVLATPNHGARKIGLLVASYYFYAYWDWRFLSLLILSTLVNYAIGLALGRGLPAVRRRWLMWGSVVFNLGLLGIFKYANFFIDTVTRITGPLSFSSSSLQIILPIGISFYTFQALSYTIDVYRCQLKPCRTLSDFALFIAFFPQLVAGPIVRASDFLPQLETPKMISWDRVFWGGRLFVFGLFKKVFIADHLAVYVDGVFENPGAHDGLTTWLAVTSYAVQIYCDFSGYSDMAIGVAYALGYNFCKNFDHPYIATSITEFWRRWHISLSTWLRDYLYISLGGNRRGPKRTYINLLVTMLLGGLWHGADWTFVFWGAWHGLALGAHRFMKPHLSGFQPESLVGRYAYSWLSWLLTMLIVLVGWVFFRSRDFTSAMLIIRQMLMPETGFAWYYPFAVCLVPLMFLAQVIHATKLAKRLNLPHDRWYTSALLFSMLFAVVLYFPRGFKPFIYFQF